MGRKNKEMADPQQIVGITVGERREYERYQEVTPKLIKFTNAYIRNQIAYLTRLSLVQKYDENAWLDSYNRAAQNSINELRIRELAEKLEINMLMLDESGKKEIGFFLYCDYLRKLLAEVDEMKAVTASKDFYFKNKERGEYLELFGMPMSVEQLVKSYKKHLKDLKEQSSNLEAELVKGDGRSKDIINSEIVQYQTAIKELKDIYNKVFQSWNEKCNGLDPGIDDRKLKLTKVKNKVLQKLLGKVEVKSKKNLSLPA